MEKIKTMAEKSTATTLQAGQRPYIRYATETEIIITTRPTTQKGISLARIKLILLTGVTLIWLMVPFSFSITMFNAGKIPHMMVSNSTMKPGIIKLL